MGGNEVSGPAELLAEILGGDTRVLSLGGPPREDWEYKKSAERLERMFTGDDGDARAVQAFLSAMTLWEAYINAEQEEDNMISAPIVRAMRPLFETRQEICQALEQYGAVRERAVCAALGNAMPEDRK
jgi:hypothetical protein